MDASNQYVNDMTFPLLVQKLRERRCLIDPGWLGGWVAGWLGGWAAGWPGGWVARGRSVAKPPDRVRRLPSLTESH
jgi:hypothetical protein